MKKQEIAKIPYMAAGEAEEAYKYIAMQKVCEIRGESHLFVEIFDNTGEGRKKPKLRMVFTKKDWCLYYVKEDIWSQGSFRDDYNRNVWESSTAERNSETMMAETDQDAIWDWCGKHEYITKDHWTWTDRLEKLIDQIKHGRKKRAVERRKRNLKDRETHTPPLPEHLEEWADQTLFQGDHFLYYKRHGRYVDICCSKCGQVTTVQTKRAESLEGLFEHVIDPPQNNLTGRCPACGAVGTWKAQGKTKGVYGLSKNFFIGMPYKGTGAVIRYLECEKIYRLEERSEDRGTVMTGASEKYIITEIVRRYLEKGKKRSQTDFHKYNPYSGKNFWDDCNLYGMKNITVNSGRIYEGTWKMLEGTILQYSGAQQFQKKYRQCNLMDYMERYTQYPQIEMLAKTGLYGVVKSMVECKLGIIADQHASRPEDFLGIHKNRLKLLREKEGDTNWLVAMQKEHRMNAHWTEEELGLVKETWMKQEDLKLALQYMSMKQLLHKLEKYSGVDLGEGVLCGGAAHRIRTTTDTYMDYLKMRQQRGYDLRNMIFLWPRNLRRAHDQMVEEINGEKIREREKEVQEKFPGIRKSYRKLRNRYYFEDEEFLIRPARSAEEIVREGRILHHCVGGNIYLGKHEKGISIILFLRRKQDPEEPYITIEMDGTRICQWYGAYDRKPDQKIIEKWLKNYKQILEDKESMIAAAV